MKKTFLTILLIGAESLLLGINAQTDSCAVPRDGISAPREAFIADTIQTSRISAPVLSHGTPRSSFSGEMLRRLSPASAADALGFFPGVRIKDYGGIGGMKTVDVRSLGSGHVGIFIDGQRITNAQNGQVDLGRYSADELESISLNNAQRSGLLMSAEEYASASVVHLRTRKPVFDGKDWNLTARFKAGSWKTFSPSIRAEKRIGKVSLSADASFLRSEGDYTFRIKNEYEDTTGRRKGGDISSSRLSLGLWASPFGGDLSLRAAVYKSERGLPGPVIRRLSGLFEPSDRQWDLDRSVQGSFRKSFGTFDILLNARATADRLDYESEVTGGSSIRNSFSQRTASLSAAMSWQPLGWLSGGLSLDNRLSDLKCDVKYFDYVSRIDTRAAATLKIDAGSFALQPSVLFTRVEDFTEGAAKTLVKVSPAVVATWEDGSGIFTARTFWKDIFRVPTFNDLYYTLTGNAAIRPEYATQADIGFDLVSPQGWKHQFRLSADAFLNRVRDKIVAVPVNSQFRWSSESASRSCRSASFPLSPLSL